MQTVDNYIRRVDRLICKHLDEIDTSSRGDVSEDILDQLIKLVNLIMVKFYLKDSYATITPALIEKAAENAQITSELSDLYRFRNCLNDGTVQVTLDENGSERLMLKYYQYMLEAKNLLHEHFGIEILHNLEKFPLHLDSTLQEYYSKIAEKLEKNPIGIGTGDDRYYIQKIKPLFVNNKIYREITFTPVDDGKNQTKTNRVIAFTRLDINKGYASRFHLVTESIEILGMEMPIIIIDGWEVSIRPCEFKNFAAIVKGKHDDIPPAEQRVICNFLTHCNYTLDELMRFKEDSYKKQSSKFKSETKSQCPFISVLDYCYSIINCELPGQNILRYLLLNMNNAIIKGQYNKNPNRNLSNLYLQNGSIPFDSHPFNMSLSGHNPKLAAVFACIPRKKDRMPELFARYIRDNTESKGQLFTDKNAITGFQNIEALIEKYNSSLWSGHRPESDLVLEDNNVFINRYKIDTCTIIEKLQQIASSGIQGYTVGIISLSASNSFLT